MVVGPTSAFAGDVWWPVAKLETSTHELSVGVTGACTTPEASG
jgi:hypothetical protein